MTTTTDTASAAGPLWASRASTAILLAELEDVRPLLSATYLDKAERAEHAREYLALHAELVRRGEGPDPGRYRGITPDKPASAILTELQDAADLFHSILAALHLEEADDDTATFSFTVPTHVAEKLASFGAESTDFEPDGDREDGGDAEPDNRRAPTFAAWAQKYVYEAFHQVKYTSAQYNITQTDYLMMRGLSRTNAQSCVRRYSRLFR